MAGAAMWTCALLLCAWNDGFAALAFPAGTSVDVNTSSLLPTAENAPANDLSTAYVVPASQGIWQITETGGNESKQEGDGLEFKSGWTVGKRKEQLETMEGWLNSGIISKDTYVPYRANALSAPVGNSSEDWKKYLLKSLAFDRSPYRKILFDENRPKPFQYYRQIQQSRKYWRSHKNT